MKLNILLMVDAVGTSQIMELVNLKRWDCFFSLFEMDVYLIWRVGAECAMRRNS
jgi:hypothetical protein